MAEMSIVLLWTGRTDDSLSWVDKALAGEVGSLDPDLLEKKCGAILYLGRYEEAIETCEKSAALGSDVITYVYLTAAYAQQHKNTKATAAKEQLLKRWSDFTITRWKALTPSDNAVYWRRAEASLIAGLRMVGLPEN